MTTPPHTDLSGTLIAAARSVLREHGDGGTHTVAAAVLDEHGRVHVGLNLHHFTGGPCAELVALATARAAGARAPRLIVAVGDGGRGVLAPCGRDRQVLADYHPQIRVVVPVGAGCEILPIQELLPHSYLAQEHNVQRLRFRSTHLQAVRNGDKRMTMRFNDPVQVGPALLVFEFDDEIALPGRITSTMGKPVGEITDLEAREDGFASASEVLPAMRDYYPDLVADDELVLVRFQVNAPRL